MPAPPTGTLSVTCPACKTKLAVPAAAAGKAVRCRQCGGTVRVPVAAPAAKSAPRAAAARAAAPAPPAKTAASPSPRAKGPARPAAPARTRPGRKAFDPEAAARQKAQMRKMMMIAIPAVVLIALGIGGWILWQNAQADRAAVARKEKQKAHEETLVNANADLGAGDYDKAIAKYSELIDDPDGFKRGPAIAQRGQAYLRQKKFAEAVADFKKATGEFKGQIEKSLWSAHYGLARACVATRDLQAAHAAVREAVGIPGSNELVRGVAEALGSILQYNASAMEHATKHASDLPKAKGDPALTVNDFDGAFVVALGWDRAVAPVKFEFKQKPIDEEFPPPGWPAALVAIPGDSLWGSLVEALPKAAEAKIRTLALAVKGEDGKPACVKCGLVDTLLPSASGTFAFRLESVAGKIRFTPFLGEKPGPSEDISGLGSKARGASKICMNVSGFVPMQAVVDAVHACRADGKGEVVIALSDTLKAEGAILLGLSWLARHQHADGGWKPGRYPERCEETKCSGTSSGDGNRPKDDYDFGETGLALMAFLGGGYAPSVDAPAGSFEQAVQKGLKWLADHQGASGALCDEAGGAYKAVLSHALATCALAQAVRLQPSGPWKGPLEKAVAYLVDTQTPGKGWGYKRQDTDPDISVTGWAIQALRMAEVAGCTVPSSAYSGAMEFLKSVTEETLYEVYYRPAPNTRPKYKNPGNHTVWPAVTAQGMLIRMFAEGFTSEHILKGQGHIVLDKFPQAEKNAMMDFYYWYVGTAAIRAFQGPGSGRGEDGWKEWSRAVMGVVPSKQRPSKDKCAEGSWNPDDRWGAAGGRIYSTAMNIMVLEIVAGLDQILPGLPRGR
ncbi:MAG: hypothetical protein HYY93_15315 [Planctomycetes bacterium]|nr:hypothetical protein [Planctomycetota bacterium]